LTLPTYKWGFQCDFPQKSQRPTKIWKTVLNFLFLSTARWIYKRISLSVTSSKKVNTGQPWSIKFNSGYLKSIEVCPSIHRLVHLSFDPPVHPIRQSIHPSICLSIHPSVRPSICSSICPSALMLFLSILGILSLVKGRSSSDWL
jgi:hypothetical protein